MICNDSFDYDWSGESRRHQSIMGWSCAVQGRPWLPSSEEEEPWQPQNHATSGHWPHPPEERRCCNDLQTADCSNIRNFLKCKSILVKLIEYGSINILLSYLIYISYLFINILGKHRYKEDAFLESCAGFKKTRKTKQNRISICGQRPWEL